MNNIIVSPPLKCHLCAFSGDSNQRRKNDVKSQDFVSFVFHTGKPVAKRAYISKLSAEDSKKNPQIIATTTNTAAMRIPRAQTGPRLNSGMCQVNTDQYLVFRREGVSWGCRGRGSAEEGTTGRTRSWLLKPWFNFQGKIRLKLEPGKGFPHRL